MQVLHSLVVLVALLLGFMKSTNALPNPDFGVHANINPARPDVLTEASRLLTEFNAVSNFSVTLNSGTPILAQMESAILSIASKFRSSGVTLTQRLQTLATNNGPSISAVFNSVYEAIDALKDLTTNGLSAEMMSIAEVVPSFVTQKFNEVFGDLRKALNQLTSKLQVLERDVTKARTAVGHGGHISDTIIRNNVPARVQSDVTRALIGLRLKIDSVKYMVRTTLLYLKDADEFLVDVIEEVNGFGNALSVSLYQFVIGLSEMVQNAVGYAGSAFGCSRAEQDVTLVQIMPALSAISNYSTTLQQPLEDFLSHLDDESLSVRVNAFVGRFQTYTQNIVISTIAIDTFVRDVTCEIIRNMVLTLISFAPDNEYCFNRFARYVYGLYELHYTSVSQCYDAELERLTTMTQFLRDAVDVFLYDVEDLGDNLSVCVNLSDGRNTCVEQYGMLYTSVLTVSTKLLNDAERLFAEEFVASYPRFGACVSSSQQLTLNTIAKIDRRLGSCHPLI